MGIPSALIYCHELINEYGVKNLIRVGSAGSYQEEVKLYDIVIAMAGFFYLGNQQTPDSLTLIIHLRQFSNYS